jgi:hypothetical protein
MHESERSKPARWTSFAMMPVYKEELARAPKRPREGYESHKARRVCFGTPGLAYVLYDWDEHTAESRTLFWEGE